jgi:hypothetical protein
LAFGTAAPEESRTTPEIAATPAADWDHTALAASKNNTAQANNLILMDTISPRARRDFVALFSIWGTTPSIAAICDDFNSKQQQYYNNARKKRSSWNPYFSTNKDTISGMKTPFRLDNRIAR